MWAVGAFRLSGGGVASGLKEELLVVASLACLRGRGARSCAPTTTRNTHSRVVHNEGSRIAMSWAYLGCGRVCARLALSHKKNIRTPMARPSWHLIASIVKIMLLTQESEGPLGLDVDELIPA